MRFKGMHKVRFVVYLYTSVKKTDIVDRLAVICNILFAYISFFSKRPFNVDSKRRTIIRVKSSEQKIYTSQHEHTYLDGACDSFY